MFNIFCMFFENLKTFLDFLNFAFNIFLHVF